MLTGAEIAAVPQPSDDAHTSHALVEQLRVCVEQHRSLHDKLQQELAREREELNVCVQGAATPRLTPRDARTQAQLDTVGAALEDRAAEHARTPPGGAAAKSQTEEAVYLRALISVTDRLFTEPALRTQLRMLLDVRIGSEARTTDRQALLNAVWHRPYDAYVDSSMYAPSVVQRLWQAHLVETHPLDTSRIRLIAFHEQLPDQKGGSSIY